GRPGDRRAAGSSVSPNSESRRRRNHGPPKSGIPNRKKTRMHTRLSCKLDYLLRSNHRDRSIASEFFTDDQIEPPSRNRFDHRPRVEMPHWHRKTRGDCDVVVEVWTRIRKAEPAPGATCGKDRRVGADTLTGRQLHNVTAPRLGCEARGTAKFQIGAGVARRRGQGFVERPAVEVQRGAVGREDVVP